MARETERINLRLVKDAMDGILVHHDLASMTRHLHPRFVQHNPLAKDGAAHVQEMCAFTFGLLAARWAAQGDLVAYHGLYTAPNPLADHPLVCVDVWRVQGEQIVEHWDALAPTPAADAEGMIAGGGDGLADVSPSQVSENAVRAPCWSSGCRAATRGC
jgi:predicted SnoaL-like aldol condensation-catalyzing enzyme